jgi:hypothetical protein
MSEQGLDEKFQEFKNQKKKMREERLLGKHKIN